MQVTLTYGERLTFNHTSRHIINCQCTSMSATTAQTMNVCRQHIYQKNALQNKMLNALCTNRTYRSAIQWAASEVPSLYHGLQIAQLYHSHTFLRAHWSLPEM